MTPLIRARPYDELGRGEVALGVAVGLAEDEGGVAAGDDVVGEGEPPADVLGDWCFSWSLAV